MTNSMDVLPLACSCSYCDWKLCCMKTKIKKDILVCCCGERNRPEQFVYTCTTCSANEASKPILESTCTTCSPNEAPKPIPEPACTICSANESPKPIPEPVCTTCSANDSPNPNEEPATCCQPEVKRKPCYELEEKKEEKPEPKKGFGRTSKGAVDKQAGQKSQKNVQIKCVSKECTPQMCKSQKSMSAQAAKSKTKSASGGKSKGKKGKNDLYSKIEEIYSICCCELCDCSPSPTPNVTSDTCIDDESTDGLTKHVCLCSDGLEEGSKKKKSDVGCECLVLSAAPKPCPAASPPPCPAASPPPCPAASPPPCPAASPSPCPSASPTCPAASSTCPAASPQLKGANKTGDVDCECPPEPPKICPAALPKPCPAASPIPCSAASPKPSQTKLSQGKKRTLTQSPTPSLKKTNEKKPGSPKPEKQNKEVKIALISPKPSCGQLISPCQENQDIKLKITIPSQPSSPTPCCGLKAEIKPPENEDNCSCHTKEVKGDAFPIICDCPTPAKSPSVICSCSDSNISEDGFPTCCCKTEEDKEEEECPCFLDEMPITSSDDSTALAMATACKCNSCECINCPNLRKRGEAKGKAKGGVRKKMCKCTNCLSSACRKDRKNCLCGNSKTSTNRRRKSQTQVKKYDVRRALFYGNIPFDRTESENNSVCDTDGLSSVSCMLIDNHKCRLGDWYICKNKLNEYENILSEMNRCGCSPCECQVCNNSGTDNIGLMKYKACLCKSCECVSCSYMMNYYTNPDTDEVNKKTRKSLQDLNKTINNNNVLYEKLALLKKGEILSNAKSDKEKVVNDQLRFGINKDLPLPYWDKETQLINNNESRKNKLVAKDSIKKTNEESLKIIKNILEKKEKKENSKECLNLLLPSNSGFIRKSATAIEPARNDYKINDEETVRNVKILTQLKNLCDSADEYINHLKNLLEKSKKDNENFESIVEKIKNVNKICYEKKENSTTTISKLLELLRKEKND